MKSILRTETLIIFLIIITIPTLVVGYDLPSDLCKICKYTCGFNEIVFEDKPVQEMLNIITSLFIITLLVERSIEALLIPIRAPRRHKLVLEINKHKPSDLNEEEREKLSDEEREKLSKAEYQLWKYRLGTAKRAYWMSFVFGLLISLSGFRILDMFLKFEQSSGINLIQYTLFTSIDIVLTAGVISGGSATVDKIGRKIRTFYNLKSVTVPDQN